jgi:hypothetical protein
MLVRLVGLIYVDCFEKSKFGIIVEVQSVNPLRARETLLSSDGCEIFPI